MNDQWLNDCSTLLTAAMYGCPPGGWSDPDRCAAFVADVADIEQRMRDYRDSDRATLPAPTGRPSHVRLIGGPWDGRIHQRRGSYIVGPSAMFENGWIACCGTYEYRRERNGEYVAEFRAASI